MSDLSTNNSNQASPKNPPMQLDDKLFDLFNKLIPLIDNVSDGVRAIALFGSVITAWIVIWLFFIKETSLMTALVSGGVIFLPSLVLLRFWLALEGVKDLPNIAEEIIEDVTDDVKSTWKEVSADKKKALSFIGQAKNLWEMKSLLGQLDEVFSQYLNIGLLVNPFSLVVAVLSVLAVMVLMLFAFVTVLTSIF